MLMSWQVNDVGGGIPAMEAVQADAETIVSALSPESMDIPIVSIVSPTLIFTAECLTTGRLASVGRSDIQGCCSIVSPCYAVSRWLPSLPAWAIGLLSDWCCCEHSAEYLPAPLCAASLSHCSFLSVHVPATVSTCIVNSPLSLLPS